MAPCRGPKDAERENRTKGVVRIAGLSLAVLRSLRDQAIALRDTQGLWIDSGRLYGSQTNPRPGGEELTTGDVFVEVVLPTLKANPQLRTYAECLEQMYEDDDDDDNYEKTGVATVYVIHTWGATFAETVSAIESTQLPGDYFFLDVFCENYKVLTGQRIATVQYLSGSFEQRIARVSRSLVVMSPWEKPACLERTWCMYEMLLTSITDAELLVATPMADQAIFHWTLLNDFNSITLRTSQLNIEETAASSEFAYDSIMQTLTRNDGGTRPGSVRIASALRHALQEHAAIFATTDEGKKLLSKGGKIKPLTHSPEAAGSELGNGPCFGSALLGFMTRWLGAPIGLNDAEVVARTAVTTRELTLGKSHPDTLVAVNHLAMVLDGLDRVAEAEALFRRSLASKEAALGPVHLETLTSAYNIARVLERKTDVEAVEEAEYLLRRTHVGREASVGPAHPVTLQSAHALASVLIRRSELDRRASPAKLEEAARLLRRVIAGREKTLGKDDVAYMASVDALARVFDAQGKADEAEALHRSVLASREKLLGSAHPDTLASLHHLGISLQRQSARLRGDAKSSLQDAAEVLISRALAGREQVLGPNAPETLASLDALAGIKFQRGNTGHAEKHYRKALEARRAVLGPEHTDTMVTCENLAAVLVADEEYAEAEKLLRVSLAGLEKTLGADSEHALHTAVKLARVLRKIGTPAGLTESAAILRGALAGYEKKLGREAAMTLVVVNDLAVSLELLAQLDEAGKLLRRALYGREKQFGTDNADTLVSAAALANVLMKMGKLEAAEALARRVYAARIQTLGSSNSATLDSMRQLARMLEERGELDEAEELYVAAHEATLKLKGEFHAEVKELQQALATLDEKREGALNAGRGAHDDAHAARARAKAGRVFRQQDAKNQTGFFKGNKAILTRGQSIVADTEPVAG
ncbi:hypothetical protein KFE25_012367 [Diacronema lutheri]|uniref:Kinesin light chain n=1 Tax=Diacronema lutheri TaxID=2081491 RepID=A0A8J5XQY4_DIALT|nr:hypothetical protein KFE25_012367 [Diacronema lutheri]